MKKLLVIGIIVLFLCVSLVPGITSKTSYVDDTTPPETFIEMNGTMCSEGGIIVLLRLRLLLLMIMVWEKSTTFLMV